MLAEKHITMVKKNRVNKISNKLKIIELWQRQLKKLEH